LGAEALELVLVGEVDGAVADLDVDLLEDGAIAGAVRTLPRVRLERRAVARADELAAAALRSPARIEADVGPVRAELPRGGNGIVEANEHDREGRYGQVMDDERRIVETSEVPADGSILFTVRDDFYG